MPAVSKAQFRFFEMLKHNDEMRKKKKISKKVVNEFAKTSSYGELPKKISKRIR